MNDYGDFISKYDETTKTYHLKRGAGLFANLCWAIYSIACLELDSKQVDNITMMLSEYFFARDIYPELFAKKNIKINYSSVTKKQKNDFINNRKPSYFGLGDNSEGFNFNVTSQIIDKFFQPNQTVSEYYNRLLRSNRIFPDNTVFVWARRTDKVYETQIPPVQAYIDVLMSKDLRNKEVVVQTDDKAVLRQFSQKIKFKYIKEIPQAKRTEGFHIQMCQLDDERVKHMYGITKMEHLYQMLSISLLAKNSKEVILYPGNPTTYIPMIRGSFDNCYLFKNKKKLGPY